MAQINVRIVLGVTSIDHVNGAKIITLNKYNMLKPRVKLVEYPLGFALARNGKNNLGYSKGGYPLNKNSMPLNENNTNSLKR